MEKLIVYFKADEQELVCCNPFRVSSKKVAYVEAHFDLGENWTGYDSVRAIWRNTQNFAIIGTVLDSQGICKVPTEVLTSIGQVDVNLVGSISENNVLTDRLTTYPVEAGRVDANALVDGSETAEITPSQFEQFAEAVRNDAERARTGAEAAESYADAAAGSADAAAGSAQSAADDAERIAQMIQDVIDQIEEFYGVTVSVETLPAGSQATARYEEGHLYLGIPKGEKGDTGNGIASITKTGTSGLVDTYTITFTNGQTTTFAVTNGEKGDTGNGIASITKTGTSGLIDTYTITYTDGQTETFTVTNGEKGDTGNGIDRIELTSTSGYVKTYTIYFTDGSTTTIEVTDGEVSFEDLLDYTIIQNKNESVPYKFRQSGGGIGVGDIEYDKIVGGTIAWNQLVRNGNFADSSVWDNRTPSAHSMTFADNKLSCTLSSIQNYMEYGQTFNAQSGHKYLVSIGKVTAPHTIDNLYFSLSGSASINSARFRSVVTGIVSSVISSTADSTTMFIRCYVNANGFEVGDVITFENVQVIDLTQMFGSTIADYIYSLEQATAGAGVAWFRNLFPNEYYEYDSGSLKSVEGLQSHDTTGKNLMPMKLYRGISYNPAVGDTPAITDSDINLVDNGDGTFSATFNSSWTSRDFIAPIKKGVTYHLKFKTQSGGTQNGLTYGYLDKNGKILYKYNTTDNPATYNHTLTQDNYLTSDEGYIYLALSNRAGANALMKITEPQLELGANATDYEPYIKHSYPLDNSLTLRGIPKLADGKLYYDGDTYEADGTVTRKYGIVDLGSLNWAYRTTQRMFTASLSNYKKPTGGYVVPNAISAAYRVTTISNVVDQSSGYDKVMTLGMPNNWDGLVIVRDESFTDAAAFKTAMSGVYLVYELATPTTESAQPYTNPQLVNTRGAEEYVTDSIVPVGHDTKYPMTLDDTVPLANGTYEMRITVSNGEKSVNWVSV